LPFSPHASVAREKMEKLLTAAEVAEHLRVSTNWVHSHAEGKRQPVLPSVKLGKSRMFREAEVQEFLQFCEALARDQASRKKARRPA
jgi:hypothetical protein